MKYISQSSGSTLIPKITGTYECELHHVINEIKKKKYDILIDIGCAEGYYAVGFAWLNKANSSFKVYAYDNNTEALENLKKLAVLNGVENQIIIKSWFDKDELKEIDSSNGIIICDVEGAEKEILDPESNPYLLKFDILVEVHDGMASSTIREILMDRFTRTHTVQHTQFQSENSLRVNYMSWIRNRKFIKQALNEGRKYGLDWLYFKKK
jgi:precorrin-6B methylase 2